MSFSVSDFIENSARESSRSTLIMGTLSRSAGVEMGRLGGEGLDEAYSLPKAGTSKSMSLNKEMLDVYEEGVPDVTVEDGEP